MTNKALKNILTFEAIKIHEMLFNSSVPKEIIDNYIYAHSKIFSEDVRNKIYQFSININPLIKNNLDLEAIEFALRNSDKKYLTWKIQMLLFFSETSKSYYDSFYNQKNETFKAFICLSLHLFKSTVKLLKGKLISKVYKIV